MNTNKNKVGTAKKVFFCTVLLGLTIGLTLTQPGSSSVQGQAGQNKGQMNRIPNGEVLKGGEGQQQGRINPTSDKSTTHLHLVLRITQDGEAEVIKATELPGEAPLTDAPTGNFAYEVLDDSQPVAVEAMTDPFELRSFSGPENSETFGHNIERAESATIVVKVPTAALDSVKLDKLTVRVYRLKPEVNLEKFDLDELQRMKQGDQVEKVLEVASDKLAPQIKQKGRRLLAR